ncbi:MAG: hypothetical protein R3362_04415 [Rhodothermales bacterium]|nr:hypothetical protein [Rhodothermales bacterium]
MPNPLVIENRTPEENPAGGLLLGLLRAEGVAAGVRPDGLDAAIARATSVEEPDAVREARRKAARDMLRNGRYKPTGRGKPASEYLLRAAAENAFPRINALVDVNNLVSAESALPVSLWDLDRAGADHYRFRLGREGEEYVFNPSGQTLKLHDLVVGCRVPGEPDGGGEPIVSPIKDSQPTKTTAGTRRVAACVYAPCSAVSPEELEGLCDAFADWLARCGSGAPAAVTWQVARPGETVRV